MANGPAVINTEQQDRAQSPGGRGANGPLCSCKLLVTVSGVTGFVYLLTRLHDFLPSWLVDWLRWCPTSFGALDEAEKRVLSYLKRPYSGKFINISGETTQDKSIWTLSMNTDSGSKHLPLVLLHGFASGVGLWVLSLDNLSSERPLYAIDILGFGRSSRPSLSRDPLEAERQLVQSIEDWRKKMGLQKFILLGHSMGGFLATSYAIEYPEFVSHLVLADPWGFPERPINATPQFQPPAWVKIVSTMLQPFNPLAGLRAAGPWGPRLVGKFRPDLGKKFASVVEDSEAISSYLYHCNAQNPSGESAFKSMTSHFGWAKHPMLHRIDALDDNIPITFIYGSRSWVDSHSGFQVKEMRPSSYVDVQLIHGAGHHVYADKPDDFNNLVNMVCHAMDGVVSKKQTLHEANINDVSLLEKTSFHNQNIPSRNTDEQQEYAGGPVFYTTNS